jgi:hypothetical protein
MTEPQNALPSAGKAILFIGIGLVLFGCGLCLGATAATVLTRPGLPRTFSAPAGSALDNPAPPGTAIAVGDLEIQVTGVVRPADDIVAGGNMFNPEPEPGNEMVLVTLSVTCQTEEDDTCAFAPSLDFLLVSPQGVHRPEWLVTGLPNLLSGGEISSGETVSGDMLFEVGKGETGLVLVYTESLGDEVAYLGLPPGDAH